MAVAEMADDEVFLGEDQEGTSADDDSGGSVDTGVDTSHEAETQTRDDGFTDEEREAYGKRVRKRISQLTKRHAEERAADKAELADLKRRLSALEADKTRAAEDDLDARLTATKKKYREALDQVDTEAQMAALDELTDLKAEIKLRRHGKTRDEDASGHQESAAESTRAGQPEIPAAAKRWNQRNAWYNDPANRSTAGLTFAKYQALLEEGFDPSDQELYDELDKFVAAQAPHLAKSNGAQRQTARATSGGVSATDPGPSRSQARSRQITRDDLVKMRKYGFNPDSAADRKAWLVRNDPL
jgi:hypothetical protein